MTLHYRTSLHCRSLLSGFAERLSVFYSSLPFNTGLDESRCLCFAAVVARGLAPDSLPGGWPYPGGIGRPRGSVVKCLPISWLPPSPGFAWRTTNSNTDTQCVSAGDPSATAQTDRTCARRHPPGAGRGHRDSSRCPARQSRARPRRRAHPGPQAVAGAATRPPPGPGLCRAAAGRLSLGRRRRHRSGGTAGRLQGCTLHSRARTGSGSARTGGSCAGRSCSPPGR
jgi:hypothetical protein